MNKVDYKKLYKELYLPKNEPVLIDVPSMTFLMVDGKGNPNDTDGEYSKAVELLYALSYTIKMSSKSGQNLPDFFDYVVPPLEGLWWLNDSTSRDFQQKDAYQWISMIRQPEFVTNEVFAWAQTMVKKKKPELDVTKARLEVFTEGLCVQMMHFGPYDTEPESVKRIDTYISNHDLTYNIGNASVEGWILRHHEIYLNDPRKVNPDRMQTIIRHPVKHR